MAMTIAEKVSALMGDRGDTFLTEDGRHLHDIALELGATVETNRHLWRYEFPDGSAIVACELYWDLEGSKPWSFAGEEVLEE